MTPTRPIWRVLAAILLIVAFVLPPAAHAYAGHEHGMEQVAAAAVVDHADHRAAEPVDSQAGERPVKAHPHTACCAACACHASLAVLATAPASRLSRIARLVPLPADAGHPSVTPETLPEPPRSFA